VAAGEQSGGEAPRRSCRGFVVGLIKKAPRTCKKFCVNGYTTRRRKYGLFKRSPG
jgi:hypothetical protein